MNETNEVSLKEKMAHEVYTIVLKEAQRNAHRMRTELNKALGSLDAIDDIVGMALHPTLYDEADCLNFALSAQRALLDATEANHRALSQGNDANKNILLAMNEVMRRLYSREAHLKSMKPRK